MKKLKLLFILTLTAALSLAGKAAPAQHKFEKERFYRVMAGGDLDEINNEIEVVKDASVADNEGYEGALLMRKAGLLPKAKEKLAAFKEGRIKLETAIMNRPENAELHFLRLTIEEHAPKVVKYRADIEKDKEIVLAAYRTLSPAVRQAVADYAKTSKVIHPDDLKTVGNG